MGPLCPPGRVCLIRPHAWCLLPPQIRDLQREALVRRAARAAQQDTQRRQFPAEHVRILCINCTAAVGYGSDLRKVEGAHHVNVNPNFS